MQEQATSGASRSIGSVVLRVVLALVALAAILLWVANALVLLVFQCDENCSGDQADSWVYFGQAVLTAAGSVVGIAGLARAVFLPGTGARELVVVSAGCAIAWLLWIPLSAAF